MADYMERVNRIVEKERAAVKYSEQETVADWLLGQSYIIYWPSMAKMLDSVPAAILLCKIWFWTNTTTSQERAGWFYWTQKEITEQTGLSRRVSDTGKAILRERGILKTEFRGLPAKLWWQLDKEEFFRQCRLFIDSSVDSTEDSSEDS